MALVSPNSTETSRRDETERGTPRGASHTFRRAYSRPVEHAIIRSRYRKYQWRNGSLIPRPAPCQCLSFTSFISFSLHFFVISPSPPSPPLPSLPPHRLVLRGSAACTRCFSSPDDYIDRVGGWDEASETVWLVVRGISISREREKKRGRERRECQAEGTRMVEFSLP